jgi:hypothetical protein
LLPYKPLLTPLTRRLLQKTWDQAPEFIRHAFAGKAGLFPSMHHLSGFNHFDLEASPEGKLVDWYNIQFYCGWGDASNTAGYIAVVSSGWDPKRLVLGVPTNIECCGGKGWHNLGVLRRTIEQLNGRFGKDGWGGVMGWEFYGAGRDDGLNGFWEWVSVVGSALGRGGARVTVGAGASIPQPSSGPSELPLPLAPAAETANINATVQAENAILPTPPLAGTADTNATIQAQNAAELPVRSAPESTASNEADVSRLVEMGFDRAEAIAALEAMGGDVDGAAGLLFGD